MTQAAYRLNGELISAEHFYQIACDPRRSVAVEACAGAGKTWMLVSRILRALLDGGGGELGSCKVQPHEILAITFTKRAASEMRERLYNWLAEFAQADHQRLVQALVERGISKEAGMDASCLLPQQLSNLYQSVLDSARQVQVRTFHSWFAALLRTAPLALLQQMDLPASYELLEDDAQPKALVWRRFYAALVAHAQAAQAQGLTTPGLQADYEALVLEHGRSQTERALQTALDKRTEFALADAHGVVVSSVQPVAEVFPSFAGLEAPDAFLTAHPSHWQCLREAAKALGAASAPSFSAKGVALEQALSAGDVNAAIAALLTKEGVARKFGEKIVGIASVRQAQALVLQVLAARAQHAAWHYQQRLTRLTRLLLQEFAAVKREHGWVDMNDVERAALVMLRDPVLSGWIQERLDARIKHLLIDEFQDTNPLQWQALKSWLSGYAGAGSAAPSVFIVGDPKQSIYRFRRAEPQVFLAAQAFVREGLGGALLSCDHTRRNATGVIACVNAAMAQAVTEDGYCGFRPHTTSAQAAGAVLHLPAIPREARQSGPTPGVWRDSLTTPRELPEETLRTLEARQAAAWLVQHLQTQALLPQDLMVLSRRRSGLLPMQDELRRLGLASQVGEKTELIETCEVQDIVALLDLLVSPQHDLALARVLKSPLFGAADEALVTLALAAREVATQATAWFDLLEKTALMTQDGRGLHTVLTRWKTWLQSLPPHDALQSIYSDGDVLARYASAAPANQREAVLANLRALLGVALDLGGGRFATPYALVRALKAGGILAPVSVNPQAVRLLTVHGAKGLEAHTVLLLDADTPTRAADTMGVLVDWPGEAAWPQRFVFLASEGNPPADAAALLQAEWQERQREELNALYVALTRARHALVASSIEPYRAAPRSWWQRLLSLSVGVDVSVQPAVAPALDAHEDSFCQLKSLGNQPVDFIGAGCVDVKSSAVQVTADTANSDSARLGQAMHRLLEWVRVDHAATAAVACEFTLSAEQASLAAQMAQAILTGAGAWAWDPAQLTWQGSEVELVFEGETLRLDRLVQRRDTSAWWVLDHKSEHQPQSKPELVAQLSRYRQAVQAIYPQAQVCCGFLTPLGALVELSASQPTMGA